MVTKRLNVSRDEILDEIADAISQEQPTAEWVNVREISEREGITYSCASGRLNRAHELGIMEMKFFGTRKYYRMAKTDD